MSRFYNPKRNRNLFDPSSKNSCRLSRSKLELFFKCSRCFYLDLRYGISQPPSFPFRLNAAVDSLLKKEFDLYRKEGKVHPLLKSYNIPAVPFQHEKIGEWRNNLKGLDYFHQKTNFIVSGVIDDVWINPQGELIVVDYKATSKNGRLSIDDDWQSGYKRQVEVYQWLFRQQGFLVSDTAYFIYCNGKTDKDTFEGRLEFDVEVIPYRGSNDWIEGALASAKRCLLQKTLPEGSPDCDFCQYRKEVQLIEKFD